MDHASIFKTRVYSGPNLLSEHPVVSLTIPISMDTVVQASVVDALLGSTPAGSFVRSISAQNGTLTCSSVTLALTRAMLAASGTPELGVNMLEDLDQQPVIVARYYDPSASLRALQASFHIARELAQSGGNLAESGPQITGYLTQQIKELSNYAPDELAHALIRTARIKNIPFRNFASTSTAWLFGHGAKSVQFVEAITSSNGMPGIMLARNKAYTNKIIAALGFPTTRFGLARSLGFAKNIAKTIGYPVVVKPVSGGRGWGVTAGITQDAEFDAAFKNAAAKSRQSILVENHVVGDDYRIAVFGGRLGWVVKRMPAQVTGDGKQSVQQLIDQENRRREQQKQAQFDLKSIVVDDELVRVLRKQGYSLDDCLPENTAVVLSSVANISTGGTYEDCTSIIHPDNVEMVECITRNFRLGAAGVDFITPDITRSWRECECAVIEVNGAPGFSTDEHARLILERSFAGDSDGRIPIVLVLNCAKSIHHRVVTGLVASPENIAYVSADTCKIGNCARGDSLTRISDKVSALLSDPACRSLVVGLSSNDIEANGLPVDRCAVTLHSLQATLPDPVRNLVEIASGVVAGISSSDDFEDERLRNILAALN